MRLMTSQSSVSPAEADAYAVIKRGIQKTSQNTEDDLNNRVFRLDERIQENVKELSK